MTETLPLTPLSPIAPEVAQKLSLSNIITIAVASLFALLILAAIAASLIIYMSLIDQKKASVEVNNRIAAAQEEKNRSLKTPEQIAQELVLAKAQVKVAETQAATAQLQADLQKEQVAMQADQLYGDPRQTLARQCLEFINENISSPDVRNSNGLRIGTVQENIAITLSVVESNINAQEISKKRKVLDLPHQASYSNYLNTLLDQDLKNRARNSVVGVTGPNQVGKTSSAEAFMSLLSGKKIKLTIKASDFSTKENFDSLVNFLKYLRADLNKKYKGEKVNLSLFVDELDNKAYDGKDNKEKYHITLLRMQSLMDDFFKSDVTSDVQDPKHTYYLFFAGNNSERFKKESRPNDSYDKNWTSQLNTILHRTQIFHFDPITEKDALQIGNYLGKTKFLNVDDNDQEKNRCVKEIKKYVKKKVTDCVESVNKESLKDLLYKHSQGTLTDYEGANKYFLELMHNKGLNNEKREFNGQRISKIVKKYSNIKAQIDHLNSDESSYERVFIGVFGKDWKVCDYLDNFCGVDESDNYRKKVDYESFTSKPSMKLMDEKKSTRDESLTYRRNFHTSSFMTQFKNLVDPSESVCYWIKSNKSDNKSLKNIKDLKDTAVTELTNELEEIQDRIIGILQEDIKENYNDFTLRDLDLEFNRIKAQQPSNIIGGHSSVLNMQNIGNP